MLKYLKRLIVFASVVGSIIFVAFIFNQGWPDRVAKPVFASADWYNQNWTYRKQITILGSSDSALTNYQMRITVHQSTGTDYSTDVYLGNNVNADYSDLRFTKADGTTLLSHWIETPASSTSATVWIEFDSIPQGSTANFYVYYGNSSATSTSDGVNTFVFFDDFNDGSLNTDLWSTYGSYGTTTESNGVVTVTSGGYARGIYSKTSYSNAYALRGRAKQGLTTSAGPVQFGFLTPGGNVNYDKHFTAAFRYYSGDTDFTGISGNGTSNQLPNMVVDKDTNFHISECKRYSSNGTNYDRFTIDDGSAVAGNYPTTISRQIIGFIDGDTGETITLDWVALRNFTANEPTWSYWGGEETSATESCQVTVSPSAISLAMGGTEAITAVVSSGQGEATINQMNFGSYTTSIATVNPVSTSTSPYSATVAAVAAGSTAVWATANLSDGRICQSSGATDADISVLAPTATPTPTPKPVYTAGWRNSDYGMQDPQSVCQGPGAYDGACTVPASYWVNAAQGMAAKFPGSEPGGVYTVGYIHNMGTAMPYELQSTLGTMSYVTYTDEGMQADPEEMFDAFDAAGLKILIGIEPGKANINVLADKILNKYKHHPSVIGMAIDAEWFKGESGTVTMTAADITNFRNAIEAVDPDYITAAKHYNTSKLTAGVARVVYFTDTCNFNSLADAVDDYVAWAEHFNGSRVGYQFGYDEFEVGTPDDQLWWGPLGTAGQPAVVITNAILAERPNTDIFMIYWADFTISTQFPYTPITGIPTPTLEVTPTLTPTPTPTLTPTPTPTGNWYNQNWNYRKQINILGSSDSALANYQMRITAHQTMGTDSAIDVYLGNNVNADYSDLRFTKSDGITPLSHWVETPVSSDSATVWVEFDSIPQGSTANFYVYYGNSSATSTSDGVSTFVFFDDFEDGSFNTNLWNQTGSYGTTTESDGLLTLTSGGYNRWVYSKNSYVNAFALRARARQGSTTSTGMKVVGFLTPGANINYDKHYTVAFRYYSGDTYFTGVSGNGTSKQLPNMMVAKDTSFHISEARRYAFNGTNYDKFKIDYSSVVNGNYPTNIARNILIKVGGSSGETIITDWVALRNLTANEPTWNAWGSEEAR